MFKFPFRSALAALALVGAGTASASVVRLDFEGLTNLQAVGNYYNGGAGGSLGISFTVAALALIDFDAGGTGNFANEPTPSTVMAFNSRVALPLVDIAAGFSDAFSFFYTTVAVPGSVLLYDGLNGTGSVLATISLPGQSSNCNGDPNGTFCNWAIGSATFTGVVKSISFGGVPGQIGYDNLTFGSTDPNIIRVPEPASLALAGLALAGLALARRRRG